VYSVLVNTSCVVVAEDTTASTLDTLENEGDLVGVPALRGGPKSKPGKPVEFWVDCPPDGVAVLEGGVDSVVLERSVDSIVLEGSADSVVLEERIDSVVLEGTVDSVVLEGGVDSVMLEGGVDSVLLS
jgi:hypothetical protein